MAKVIHKEGGAGPDVVMVEGDGVVTIELSRAEARSLNTDHDELAQAIDEAQGEAEEADAVLVIVIKQGEI